MSIDKYKQYLGEGVDGMDDFPRYKKGMSTVPIDPEENKRELDETKRYIDDIELMTSLEKGQDAVMS